MSYVAFRRIAGAMALGAVVLLGGLSWMHSSVRDVVGDLVEGLKTAWVAPREVPVTAVYGECSGDSLEGGSVYFWDGERLRWVGIVAEYREKGGSTSALVVYRPAAALEAENLEAVIYARRFTIGEILQFIVAHPETEQELAAFLDRAAAEVIGQLPRLAAVAWDAGLDEVVEELVAHIAEEFQRHQDGLEASAARILSEFMASLQEPAVRRRWEPIVRDEFTPVVKQITKDAVKISWPDARRFGRRLVEAMRKKDVTAMDAITELILARLGDALQKNSDEIRRATSSCVRRLVSDQDLRSELAGRLEPVVREELNRVVEILLTAVRNAFQNPEFRRRIRDLLLNEELRTEVIGVVEQFQDDAYELVQRIAQPDGRLREEVALLAKVNALGEGLPVVIVRPAATASRGRKYAAKAGE